MKKYRLLCDLGTSKKGDVLEADPANEILYPTIYQKRLITEAEILLMLKAGLLEESVDEKNWKPEDEYWYICTKGTVQKASKDKFWEMDKGRFDFGNCFATRKLAEEALEVVKKALAECRKI